MSLASAVNRRRPAPPLADDRSRLARNSARALLIGASTVLAFTAGCGYEPPGKPKPGDRPKTPAQVMDFDVLFNQSCTGCHGADGKLGPAPPLNDPIFLAIVPDDVLTDVITDGRDGTPMPAFARGQEGTLTAAQIKLIADGLKQRWKSGKVPKGELPPYAVKSSDEPPSEEVVKRGQKLFATACALCHGEDGAGSTDGESPGRINDPALLALLSDQALRRIIITGRPDLGMPDFADDMGRDGDFQPLSSDDISDLVALLASWRNRRPQLESTTAQAPPELRVP